MYLKLYDDTMPERREPFGGFLALIAKDFEGRGIDVVGADVCRIADEFKAEIAIIKAEDTKEPKAKNAMPGKPAILVE